jgi:HEAT repeat protein
VLMMSNLIYTLLWACPILFAMTSIVSAQEGDAQQKQYEQMCAAARDILSLPVSYSAEMPVKYLSSQQRSQRWAAAVALGALGSETESTIEAIAKLLSDEELAVRQAAVWALCRIGPKAIPVMRDALMQKEKESRIVPWALCRELAQMGESGVTALAVVVKDSDNWIARQRAAEALGSWGPNAVSAVPALIEMIQEDRSFRRFHSRFAAEALGRIGPAAKAAIPVLEQAAQDKGELSILRPMAQEALKQINQKNP